MKYLPRNCNHCLNPACVAACPSGAIYKREEDGVVLVSQDICRGWRHCIPACPYKKVFYNWKTNKAEKCTFCYPRLENGLPTVCTDTCVGRIRYLGILLYDMDAVFDAAKTDDPKMIYAQMLGLIKDPNDPEVLASARKEGVSEAVLNAAKISPVYQLIKGWNLALPLHPEFRTLPMVWYVPPLSPIAKKFEDKVYLPNSEAMRIPIKYLAELFTAGNTDIISQVLQRLLDMRSVMRQKEIGEAPPQGLELDVREYEKMYKLLGIAKYSDRIKLPAGLQGKTHEQLRELQGSAGYICPGGCC